MAATLRTCFLALCLAAPAAAIAHPLDMGAVELKVEGEAVEESLFLSGRSWSSLVELGGAPSQSELDALAPALFHATLGASPLTADGQPCVLQPVSASLEGIGARLVARGQCPAGARLRQRFAFLGRLSDGHRLVIQASIDGQPIQRLADRAVATASFERAPARGLGQMVALGIEHIFTGWDHLLFLLGLLLAGGSLKRLLGVVSAFTLAHSVTLALAALQVVSLPSRLVESAIAASIMVVAVENFLGKGAGRRWLIAFLFGLIHGFGFASALAEMHLSHSGVAQALLGFNLGVEAGQAALVLPAAPLIALARRRALFLRYGLPGLSLASLAVGAYWFVGRAFQAGG